MRKVDTNILIPTTPRGSEADSLPPKWAYVFTKAEHQAMLQDPQCRVDIFKNEVIKDSGIASIPSPGEGEIWFITDQGLVASRLGHWLYKVDPDAP